MPDVKFPVAKVWNKFHSLYGVGTWDRQYPIEHVGETWSRALQRFEQQAVLNALLRCIDAYSQYPPTLAQFLALVKAEQKKIQAPALPNLKPQATDAEINEWMIKLNRMLDDAKKNPISKEGYQAALELLGLDDESMEKKNRRHAAPGTAAACKVVGCSSVGAIKANGSGFWYCAEHFMGGMAK